MRLMQQTIVMIWAGALLACGVSDPHPSELTLNPSITGPGPITRCVEGCLDTDSDPTGAGYFLPGTENQYSACADPSIDQDSDGLDDNCEYKLALQFRPLLSTAYADDVSREPRWAAEWLDNDYELQTVRIAYLPSYWMDYGDGGTSQTLCTSIGGFFSGGKCNAHTGDSEWIVLDVKYNSTNKHWFLADAYFSAHEWHLPFNLRSDTTLITAYSHHSPSERAVMEYPEKKGGYPRVYVADRKHANYPTNSYCDSHGGEVLGVATDSDDCDSQRIEARLAVGAGENIGSRTHQFIDCVQSGDASHPNYGNGRTECYWTVKRFSGWFGVSPDAAPYSSLLSAYIGF